MFELTANGFSVRLCTGMQVHELSLSTDGTCPGDTSIVCKDDADIDPLYYYYNDADTPQQLFFVVANKEEGPFTIKWSVVPGLCAGAVDLDSKKSPLTTDLSQATNSEILSCSTQDGGLDIAFKYTLQPGMSIRLRVSENYNHFISELRVGLGCPGNTLVECSAELTSMPLSYHNQVYKLTTQI